jgi:hypothetical protein
LTEPARPSRPPPSLVPPLGRFLTLIPSGDLESPTSSSLDSGELWRDPPPPYGVSAPPRRALPPDHEVSLSSPPIVAIAAELRPVDLALAARSAPASLAGASALASGCLRWLFIAASVGWQPATPTSSPCCARPLGHEHDAAPSPSQPLDGGLVATTVAAPSCCRHGLLPCSSVHPPVSFFSSPCLSVLATVAWPASQACLPMLLLSCSSLCCCFLARACDAATAVLELLC